MFPNAEVQVLKVSTSDHLPILLHLNMQVYVVKSRKFKFENVWIRDADCLNLVQDSWSTDGLENILDKIEYCCLKLDE